MKIYNKLSAIICVLITITFTHCTNKQNYKNMENPVNIIFLHHSTGNNIWKGGKTGLRDRIIYKLNHKSVVDSWFKKYNQKNGTNYVVKEQYFPKKAPYGWKNYPFDYYNIWVRNAGDKPYQEEPTLEILTNMYDVIIWKHCFPVSAVQPSDKADINSEVKTLDNYKLQYEALKTKMKQFPKTKFIVWTGAVLVKDATTEDQAKRYKEFYKWIVNNWDEPGDNIFLWDFYKLETDGGLYLKDEFAASSSDSHPNSVFSGKIYRDFCRRIVDVIQGKIQ